LNDVFKLVTGRTQSQADGLHRGKDTEAYRSATERVEMNTDDMGAMQMEEGSAVQLSTNVGQVEVAVHAGELPRGLLFMPLGPAANRLIGVETEATGTPRYKGLLVTVRPVVREGEVARNG